MKKAKKGEPQPDETQDHADWLRAVIDTMDDLAFDGKDSIIEPDTAKMFARRVRLILGRAESPDLFALRMREIRDSTELDDPAKRAAVDNLAQDTLRRLGYKEGVGLWEKL